MEKKMFMPDNCDVKQIFRNDFVDMIKIIVNSTDYYTFEVYGNARSQGPNWCDQSIRSACSARAYFAFINALDKQIESENICVVFGGTCDNDCVWVVCAEKNCEGDSND